MGTDFLFAVFFFGGGGRGLLLLRFRKRVYDNWRGCCHVLKGNFAHKSNADNSYTPCSNTPLRLLTKGDNNLADDTELYAVGQSFLNRKEDVIGSVVGFIPFVGYVTILLSEHPWLKQVMLGMMGVMVVLQRE